MTLVYTRSGTGQLTGETSTGLSLSAQSYGYTQLEQLAQGGASGTPVPYSYDASGNPTQTASFKTQISDTDSQVCWSTANTITSPTCGTVLSGATSYSYDSRGNRTAKTLSGTTTSFGWDQANRLKSYGSTAAYTYNGQDLLTQRVVSGTTTTYTWQDNGGLPLLLSSAGYYYYLYGPDGAPFEQITGATPTYLHHDQAGSTRAITSQAGAVTGTYNYDPYGKATHGGSATTSLQWDGQYLEATSGLYYLRARFYDSSAAVFISKDPMSATTGEPYEYATADPLNSADLTGLITEPGGGSGGLSAANPVLQDIIKQLYRPGAVIGDGGTADALRAEVERPEFYTLSGTHYIKVVERIRQLQKLLANPKADLCVADRATAEDLLADLEDARDVANAAVAELVVEAREEASQVAAETSILGQAEATAEGTGEVILSDAENLGGDLEGLGGELEGL